MVKSREVADPTDGRFLDTTQWLYNEMGLVLKRKGDLDGAAEAYAQSKEALIKVLKLNERNSKFWNGLKKQLIKYLEVEKIKNGHFLVVCYTENDFERIKEIDNIANKLSKETGFNINISIVDATLDKPSASKL